MLPSVVLLFTCFPPSQPGYQRFAPNTSNALVSDPTTLSDQSRFHAAVDNDLASRAAAWSPLGDDARSDILDRERTQEVRSVRIII